MGDWYELRWYAHMNFRHIYVMELEVHVVSDSVTVQFSNNGGKDSEDIDFHTEELNIKEHLVVMSCGSTLEPETVDTKSVAVCMASSDIRSPVTVTREEDNKVFTYLTALYTSLDSEAEVEVEDTRTQTVQEFTTALLMTPALLRRLHVRSWARLWESGVEVVSSREDSAVAVAVAVNASWFAILSSVREDWAYGLAPGGLTNYYNGHSFWDTEVC